MMADGQEIEQKHHTNLISHNRCMSSSTRMLDKGDGQQNDWMSQNTILIKDRGSDDASRPTELLCAEDSREELDEPEGNPEEDDVREVDPYKAEAFVGNPAVD